MSVDMQQLSFNVKNILDELNKFRSTQEAGIQDVEESYCEKLQEIQQLRKKFNVALDALENTALKQLAEIRTTLQTSLKKDVDNCSRLQDELKQLSEAVNFLYDKSKKEYEFIACRKCLDKIQESESYLKESPVHMQSSIIFQANIDIEQCLSQQSSLGRIVDRMQSLRGKMNPDQVMTVKRKLEYIVRISSDIYSYCSITGICCLPSGEVIVSDYENKKVKLLDQHYNMSSHCDVSGAPGDVCQITSSEVAVSVQQLVQFVTVQQHVQFISVSNGQLVNGRKFQLQHKADCIAHHQGALYVTSGTALYQYNLTGSLVKKLYENDYAMVMRCAVSPAGDRIYVTIGNMSDLITLATDGTLISTFTGPEVRWPSLVHVTPYGQVLVCVRSSNIVIQVDREGRKKLGELISEIDRVGHLKSLCYNNNTHHIIVGLYQSNKIIVMALQL